VTRRILIVFATVALIASLLPVVPALAAPAAPNRSAADALQLDIGEGFDQPSIQPTCGVPGLPNCPPSQLTSGGSGGYIPVPAERILSSQRIAGGQSVLAHVSGAGAVPEEGVAAVVLSVSSTGSTGWSSLTVWPAGSPRPSTASFPAQPKETDRNLIVVAPGDDGDIAVFNARGSVLVTIDVLGWFSAPNEINPVPTTRIFQTDPANGQPSPLEAGATINVAVTDRAGVPAAGVAAVVLSVSSESSSAATAVTISPSGEAADVPSLYLQQAARRASLVILPPGDDGAVSVHNSRGKTHLSIDLLGWIPSASSYRPAEPMATVFDSAGVPLAAGASVDIKVTGKAGVPVPDDDPTTPEAHSVIVHVTAQPRTSSSTTLTLWPTAAGRPAPGLDTVSLAASKPIHAPTASLTIVPIGDDGMVSLYNSSAAAEVTVAVVGWFATPAMAAVVEVPETVQAPPPEEVTAVEIAYEDPQDPDSWTEATVTLADADDVQVADFIALGITDDTPMGLLGQVTEVDGNSVTVVPALLEEVFPQGDIAVALGGEDQDTQAIAALSGWTFAPAATPAQSGLPIDSPFGEENPCTMGGGVVVDFGPEVSMDFRVKWSWRSAPRVTALARLGARAQVGLSNLQLTCQWEKVIGKKSVQFMAGSVPVVVTFQWSAALDLDMGLTPGLNLGGSARGWVQFGISDNSWAKPTAHYELGYTVPDLAKLRDHLSAYAMADAWIQMDILLYGVIGPRLALGPFLEMAASAAANVP
jgi:hypothetical protein